jgi:NitT/TauT family transport system ATP-binding protein
MMEIRFERVSKAFTSGSGRVQVLHDFSLAVSSGEFLCVVGPSGCGKSTLLNLVAGLERPDLGRVWVGGMSIEEPSRTCGMIFQEPPLFPWLSVLDNIAFALRMAQVPEAERRERAAVLLERVGLRRFGAAWSHELSGGMKQRVALAAALAKDPDVLLLDEPFASLDAQTRDELHEMLEDLWQTSKKTVIFVTHNVREAVRLGDRVVLMTAREGAVSREYPIELPRNRHLEDVNLVQIASVIRNDLRDEMLGHRAEELCRDRR